MTRTQSTKLTAALLANSRCRVSIFSRICSVSSRAWRRRWVRFPRRSHWSQILWQRALTEALSWYSRVLKISLCSTNPSQNDVESHLSSWAMAAICSTRSWWAARSLSKASCFFFSAFRSLSLQCLKSPLCSISSLPLVHSSWMSALCLNFCAKCSRRSRRIISDSSQSSNDFSLPSKFFQALAISYKNLSSVRKNCSIFIDFLKI